MLPPDGDGHLVEDPLARQVAEAVGGELEVEHLREPRLRRQVAGGDLVAQVRREALDLVPELQVAAPVAFPVALGDGQQPIAERLAGERQQRVDRRDPVDPVERAADRHPRLPDDGRQPSPFARVELEARELPVGVLTHGEAALRRGDETGEGVLVTLKAHAARASRHTDRALSSSARMPASLRFG
ncbi:MAG: hypothetical protein R2991_14260 [Thermoanaerobaculia bacterium]